MSYCEFTKERIQIVFQAKNISADGRKFMGGYCFFMNDKMCIGLDIDKKTNQNRLMARIGENATKNALQKTGCSVMDITGKPMKGLYL